MYLNKLQTPVHILDTATSAVIEFAGVKFKVTAETGQQYLSYVQNGIIKKIMRCCPVLRQIVIVEEKYSFTPDSMKAATRQKRETKDRKSSIAHLKVADELVNSAAFDKKSVLSTASGRKTISTCLAANVSSLDIKGNIVLVIDSELTIESEAGSDCQPFSVPIKCLFNKDAFQSTMPLKNIHQRKGEAEMAQLDWLLEVLPGLQPGEGVLCFVTSGDIDVVVIHLFTVSNLWPRYPEGNFVHPVHVVLQKAKSVTDVYNIIAITRRLEASLGEHAGVRVAAILSMGGNDFLRKFHSFTHSKVFTTTLSEGIFNSLISITGDESGRCAVASVDEEVYLTLVKSLYCPSQFDSTKLTFEEVRQYSIRGLKKDTFNNPQL